MKPHNLLCGLILAATAASAQFSTPVRDVDNPGRAPLMMKYECSGVNTCSTLSTIPAGFRFVITRISGSSVFTSEPVLQVSGLLDNGSPMINFVLPAKTLTFTGFHFAIFASSLDLASDQLPTVNVLIGSATSNSSYFYLVGYLLKK